MKEVTQILHLMVIVIIVLQQVNFLINLKKMVELVLHHVNQDIIEVEDNQEIVHLHVTVEVIIILMLQRDIF